MKPPALDAAHRRAGSPLKLGLLVPIVLLSVMPLQAAYAYVDPNSAGLLYQILFPMLVAIASVATALRRSLARLWRRLIRRAEPARAESDPAEPDRAA